MTKTAQTALHNREQKQSIPDIVKIIWEYIYCFTSLLITRQVECEDGKIKNPNMVSFLVMYYENNLYDFKVMSVEDTEDENIKIIGVYNKKDAKPKRWLKKFKIVNIDVTDIRSKRTTHLFLNHELDKFVHAR